MSNYVITLLPRYSFCFHILRPCRNQKAFRAANVKSPLQHHVKPRTYLAMHIPYFRIWYSTSFIILFTVTFILALISPADLIYQSIRNQIIPNVFSIGGAYILTIVLCLFIWASRIYTNRAILKEIPKPYIPIDVGEVPRKVHRLIIKQWERSAIIAWDSKPRDVCNEVKSYGEEIRERSVHTQKRTKTIIPPETAQNTWGEISHPGWSSPVSEDLPNLHYHDVIVELPNLIEAKAVSLAPPDPALIQVIDVDNNNGTIPDARGVALLQRPSNMGLREYLARLASLGLVNPPDVGTSFLSLYEYARFSASPLTKPQFRELMSTFATLLSGMTTLDIHLVELLFGSNSSSATSTNPSIRNQLLSSDSSLSNSLGPSNSGLLRPLYRHQSSTGTVLTAPSRVRSSWNDVDGQSSRRSMETLRSFVHTGTVMSNSSSSLSASLRSARSVVRLTPSPHEPGELPYQIDFPGL